MLVKDNLTPLKLKAEDLEEKLNIQQYVVASKSGERDIYEIL